MGILIQYLSRIVAKVEPDLSSYTMKMVSKKQLE